MVDLVNVLSKLVDTHGNILITDINQNVVPMTDEERQVGNAAINLTNLEIIFKQ